MDSVVFRDSQGYGCSGWIGYDCFDVQTAAEWGYASEDLIEVQENCMDTCSLCETSVPAIVETDSLADCQAVSASNNNFDFENVDTLCMSTDHSCISTCTGMVFPILLPGDSNGDAYFDIPELAQTASIVGAQGLATSQAVACLQEHSPACFNVGGNLTMVGAMMVYEIKLQITTSTKLLICLMFLLCNYVCLDCDQFYRISPYIYVPLLP